MEASTCLHTKEGEKCPVHGTKECPEVIETPRKKSKNYLLNNKTIGEAKEKDHEYSMARSELKTVTNAVKRLQKKMGKKGEGNLQAWVQSKITKAADYIDTAADYVTNEETIVEKLDGKTPRDPGYLLKDWFKGWVQTGGKYDGKPCAKQPGQTTKPYCRDADVRASMDPEERERRAKKKRREDPNPNRKGKAKNVSMEAVDATKYGKSPEQLLQDILDKNPKYGGGKVIKTKLKKAEVKESYLRIQERGKTYSIILNWRGKSITTQMFFPKFGRPSKSEVLGEIVKVYPGAKVLYYNPVMRDPTQPLLFAGTQNEPR